MIILLIIILFGIGMLLGKTVGNFIVLALRWIIVGSALLWGFTHTEVITTLAHDWIVAITAK